MSKIHKRGFKIRKLIEKYGPECWICGQYCAYEDRTLDHVVPKSVGGLAKRCNVMLAHKKCNEGRGNDIIPLVPVLFAEFVLKYPAPQPGAD